jgi:hypothetical protein
MKRPNDSSPLDEITPETVTVRGFSILNPHQFGLPGPRGPALTT